MKFKIGDTVCCIEDLPYTFKESFNFNLALCILILTVPRGIEELSIIFLLKNTRSPPVLKSITASAPASMETFNFSSSIAISGNGNFVVVGTPNHDQGGSYAPNGGIAHAFMSDSNQTRYTVGGYTAGHEPGFKTADDKFGENKSISIDSEGKRYVFGSTTYNYNSNDVGQVMFKTLVSTKKKKEILKNFKKNFVSAITSPFSTESPSFLSMNSLISAGIIPS